MITHENGAEALDLLSTLNKSELISLAVNPTNDALSAYGVSNIVRKDFGQVSAIFKLPDGQMVAVESIADSDDVEVTLF